MDYLRDAGLAAASGAVLLAALAALGALGALTDLTAVAAGIVAALAVEGLFVADTPADALWERRSVRAASVAVLLAGSAALAALAGPWILAAACWGLATYFCLLALLLAGVWGGDGPAGGAGEN